MKWQKKLIKSELKHIKETTLNGSLREFERNLESQREQDAKNPNGPFACVECMGIAHKLGL